MKFHGDITNKSSVVRDREGLIHEIALVEKIFHIIPQFPSVMTLPKKNFHYRGQKIRQNVSVARSVVSPSQKELTQPFLEGRMEHLISSRLHPKDGAFSQISPSTNPPSLMMILWILPYTAYLLTKLMESLDILRLERRSFFEFALFYMHFLKKDAIVTMPQCEFNTASEVVSGWV